MYEICIYRKNTALHKSYASLGKSTKINSFGHFQKTRVPSLLRLLVHLTQKATV